MKKVLVTGASGFIGRELFDYMTGLSGQYEVTAVSLRDKRWKSYSFAGYDSVVHLAGIAFGSGRDKSWDKANETEKAPFMEVNCSLAIDVARKAKVEGVAQFVFASTMRVYGEGNNEPVGKGVNRSTRPSPKSVYAMSKYMAEKAILELDDDAFAVAVFRLPIVYGPGCENGAFSILKKISSKAPVFPDFGSRRSVLCSRNLAAFVCSVIDSGESGIFLPQDPQYVNNSQIVANLARLSGKRIKVIKLPDNLATRLSKRSSAARKTFGGFWYEQSASKAEGHEYQVVKPDEAIGAFAKGGWVNED